MDELERLRARVRELESLEHRVEYLDTMVRQVRSQADAIAGSRTWRLLTGAGALWLKLGRKTRRARHSAGIPPGAYWRWLAECEQRETAVCEKGPSFSVAGGNERTIAALRAQTYTNWELGSGGDYVLLPAAGDEYSPDALALFAHAARDGADAIYCDEDALDAEGLRVDPWFKPDWSPDFMASRDYIGRALAVRRDLAGCVATPEWWSHARNIVHIPRVLYHARSPRAKADVRVRYPIPAAARVEILIPSRNAGLLDRCLGSVRSKTAYTDYGITVIDNSDSGALAAVARRHGAGYLDWCGKPFNYAAMNNAAVARSGAPLVLFLNDDVTAIEPGWLEALVEHAGRPEVGAAGARLLYPDGRIQHAGVAIGIFGVCGHAFKGWSGDLPTYGGLGESVRNVSAVTGACLLMRREVFRGVGGFDEQAFPVAYNDIDLCLRVLESGSRIVYTPHARLVHHEAFSKARQQRDPSTAEIRVFQTRWGKYIDRDPFYNPNLTRADENYGLRECV